MTEKYTPNDVDYNDVIGYWVLDYALFIHDSKSK